MKHQRNPTSVHPPLGPYAHQIELQGPQRLLFLSGQVGMAADRAVPEDPAEQLDLALENVLRNLEAAGMDADDLVKLTIYLVDPIDAPVRAAVLSGRLGARTPCMTLVYVAGLANPALKVELDAWAAATR